ncbi:MAG: hypothetical protein MR851_00325 [[Clostridium] scindens]|nr:hypothetical protein [[Clostridium] scindens]MDY4866229.1 hypothetical protein [[Clostridium] scindens]
MNDADMIQQRVRGIYNDCWGSYKQYLNDHDMGGFNRRVTELKGKYGNDEFLISILYAFAPIINTLHAEYLMGISGK